MRVAGRRTHFQKNATHNILEEGATTIMFRSLALHISTEMLVHKLEGIVPGMCDFVYVPRDSRKNSNIALAFVNFVDHRSAQRAFEFFQLESVASMGKRSTPRVCQASVQGLALNLAYFLVKAGFEALDNPHAPHVFQNGVRVPRLADAVAQHVTKEVLQQAWLQSENNLARKGQTAASDGPSIATGMFQPRSISGLSASSTVTCATSGSGHRPSGTSGMGLGGATSGQTHATYASGNPSNIPGIAQPRSFSGYSFSSDMSLPEQNGMLAHDPRTWQGALGGAENQSTETLAHGHRQLRAATANPGVGFELPAGAVPCSDCLIYV